MSASANTNANAGADEVRGIDVAPVTAWFVEHVKGVAPPLTFAPIVGGHSNLTYCVTDAGGRRLVLRRPPLGAVLATAHDMAREHRVISAIAKSGTVPVPPALGLCRDENVNGAPFYVMDFVEGVVLESADTVRAHTPTTARAALGRDVVDVLAQLHRVDLDAVGLGDLARRENYLARQLKRWRMQWEKSKTRELAAMDVVYETLVQNIPEQRGATLVHGDYRLGNMLVGGGHRIAAVLDWELCTLGDPLADFGYLLNNWAEPGEEGGVTGRGAALAPTIAPGFPTRAELEARYQERSGREVAHTDYYRAFQYWRLAAIVEGVMSRYLKGVMGDEPADLSAFRLQIDGLALAALERVRALAADAPVADLLAASDPAQPFGAMLPWPAPTGESGKPRRSAGARVVLADGALLAWIDRAGKRLVTFPQAEVHGAEVATTVARALRGVFRDRARGTLRIEEIDGAPADTSEWAEAFVAAGYRRGYKGLELDRGDRYDATGGTPRPGQGRGAGDG